jgi:hypothetical protein
VEAGGGGIGDHPHANSTNALSVRLRRYYAQSLVFHAPARSAFLQTSQVSLVHFNPAGEPIAIGPDHRAS